MEKCSYGHKTSTHRLPCLFKLIFGSLPKANLPADIWGVAHVTWMPVQGRRNPFPTASTGLPQFCPQLEPPTLRSQNPPALQKPKFPMDWPSGTSRSCFSQARTQKVLFYLTKLDWPSYLPVQPPQGSFCLVKFMSSQGHLTNKNTSRKKTPLNLSVLFLGSMPAHIPLLCPSHTDNSSLPLIMHKVMLTGPSGKHKHTRTS